MSEKTEDGIYSQDIEPEQSGLDLLISALHYQEQGTSGNIKDYASGYV
jgi:hypothetical protein